MAPLANLLAAWALTYWLHSTLWLGGAWAWCRWLSKGRDWLDDLLWKFALLAPLVSASLQVGLNLHPLGGVVQLPQATVNEVRVAETLTPALASLSESNRLETTGGTLSSSETPWMESAAPSARLATLPVSVDVPQVAATSGFSLRIVLLAVWLMVSGGGVLWLAMRWKQGMLRLQRNRRELQAGPLVEMLNRLNHQAGSTRKIALFCSAEMEAPLAMEWGRPSICLPAKAMTGLSEEEQQTVLAHELAHLLRHDPTWLLLCRVLEVVFFFQPLNWLAGRRLQETAEFICDRWAADQTGLNVALARCLTEVATWLLTAPAPLGSVAMAGRGSQLGQRVKRLLQWNSSAGPSVRLIRWLVPALTLVLVLAIISLPSVSPGLTGRPTNRPAPPVETPLTPTHLPMLELAPEEEESPLDTAAPVPSPPPHHLPHMLGELDQEINLLASEIKEIDLLLADMPEVAAQIQPAWQKLHRQLAEVQRRRDDLKQRVPRSPLTFRD